MDTSNKEKGVALAYDIFIKELINNPKHPEQLAKESGGLYIENTNKISIRYINKDYYIDCKSGEIECADNSNVSQSIKALLLGYLTTARGQKPTGEYIKFRDIHGAAVYEEPFNSRTIKPMINAFAKHPEDFLKKGILLSGTQSNIADVSFSLNVLPLLTVTYGIYLESEEFPPEGVILFDSCAKRLCTPEIIIVAAANPIYELFKI